MPIPDQDPKLEELEALMKEFPDWKEKFPDIYRDISPQRYSKLAGKKDVSLSSPDRVIQKRASTVPHTDYQLTYQRHRAYRPRSTKRPPPSPRDPCPPPMTFETFQRTEFKPKDLGVRAEPVKMEEQYAAPDGHFDAQSSYYRDFPVHKVLPDVKTAAPDWAKRRDVLNASAKFSSNTTNKQHYKQWGADSGPAKPFAELPSFAGSVLYPGAGHTLETTTSRTFKGAAGRPADLVKLSGGNLRPEGDIDLKTTTRLAFHSFDGARPAQKVIHAPSDALKKRDKFTAQTQTKSDFAGYRRGQPRPPKPADPAPETIDLKFDDKCSFETEQRRQYPGVNPTDHPVPKSFKKDADTYTKPEVKFEAISSQQKDYRPIDIESIYKPPLRAIERKQPRDVGPLDDMTMNKQFFKKWNVKPRVKYGDFHEGHKYVPPAEKFDATTVNQDEFKTKTIEMRPSFKPDDKAIDSSGSGDFNTMYKVTFKKPTAAKLLNPKQQSILLRELKKRKAETSPQQQQGIAVQY